jgi:hypothetical protein
VIGIRGSDRSGPTSFDSCKTCATGPLPSSIIALEARGGQSPGCMFTLTGDKGASLIRPEGGIGIDSRGLRSLFPALSLPSPSSYDLTGDPKATGFLWTLSGDDDGVAMRGSFVTTEIPQPSALWQLYPNPPLNPRLSTLWDRFKQRL